jgi:hypothetical protein
MSGTREGIMTTKRTLSAGLLGGIAMYIWTAVAHMALPLGEAGIKQVPNEPAVLSAMRASLGEAHGLYVFPVMGSGPYAEKLAVNPREF